MVEQAQEPILIENWSVSSNATPYTAPELIAPFLVGEVYNHPRFEPGKNISTSPIVAVDGLLVRTYSGSVYRLGTVAPSYLEWLTEHYPNWDPENPIKMRKKLSSHR